MKKLVLLGAIAVALSACSDADTAERAVRGLGLTDVRTTGYSFFGCGEGDSFSTGFEAKSPQGFRVTGVVCSGWFKGATVRFD